MIIIFRNFFILIGGIVLSLFDFFKNFSISNIDFKSDEKSNINSKIFSKLNLEIEPQSPKQNETKLDVIRDKLLRYMMNRYVMFVFIVLFIVISLTVSLELSGMYLILLLM